MYIRLHQHTVCGVCKKYLCMRKKAAHWSVHEASRSNYMCVCVCGETILWKEELNKLAEAWCQVEIWRGGNEINFVALALWHLQSEILMQFLEWICNSREGAVDSLMRRFQGRCPKKLMLSTFLPLINLNWINPTVIRDTPLILIVSLAWLNFYPLRAAESS